MTITRRFVPVHDATSALQNRLLNSLFQDFARPEATGSFVPAVDVYEDASKIVLTLETPGIAPENLNIRVENNTLSIEGERKAHTDLKQENFHRIERRFGSFVRSFTLPQTVDTEQVSAHSEHGVLTVELPKKAAAQPKQIKVNVAAPAIEQGSAQGKTVEGEANQPVFSQNNAEVRPAQA
jgi:HSP20 family protein